MKNKIIIVVCLVVVGILVFVGILRSKSAQTQNQNMITIGAILPLTGEVAYVGEEMKKGMELAMDEYKDVPLKLVVEDDKSWNSQAAVNVVSKLINANHADIVLNSVVNTSKAIDPVLKTNKIPGIIIWDTNKTVLGLSDYTHGIGISTEGTGELMASFAYDKLKARSVAIVSSIDEWADVIYPAFAKQFENLGGKVLLSERTLVSETDFRTVIAKILSANPDVVYLPHLSPQGINIFVKQVRDLGYTKPILTGDAFTDSNIEALGEYSEGIYLAQVWLEDSNFKSAYAKKFGSEGDPISLAFAGLGYDSVKIVAEVAKKISDSGNVVSSEAIQKELKGYEFKGVSGSVTVGSLDTPNKQEKVMVVKNAKLTVWE